MSLGGYWVTAPIHPPPPTHHPEQLLNTGTFMRSKTNNGVESVTPFVTEQQRSLEAFNCFNLTRRVLICLHDKKANYTYAGAELGDLHGNALRMLFRVNGIHSVSRHA